MSDTPSKLEAIGDVLGVQDDTRDLERPSAPRKAVGDILGADRVGRPIESTERGAAMALPDDTVRRSRPRRPDPAADTTTTPSAPAPAARSSAPRSPHAAREPSRRTTANLPLSLVDRLTNAKQRRWELTQLVAIALEHQRIDDDDADRRLTAIWREPRLHRGLLLTGPEGDRLDELGERWRMNRSQVIAVIVAEELDRLDL
jgi:hypothetical protein